MVSIVGSARTSGDIDEIIADGVDGSFFTRLGEKGMLAAAET